MPESQTTQTNSPAANKKLAGYTSVKNKVLTSIAQAATVETLKVTPDDVSVSTFDDQGKLGLSIQTPVRSDMMRKCQSDRSDTLFSQAGEARSYIKSQTEKVSGHTVGRVNMIVTGVTRINEDEGRELQ